MRRSKADEQAVADLERCVIHLARALGRMGYVADYLESRGQKTSDEWGKISEALLAVEAMLENDSLEDAAAVKRPKRRRR